MTKQNKVFKTVEFTHTVGCENVAIAHITWRNSIDNSIRSMEYAVVKFPDFADQSWGYALKYVSTYEEAKETYNSYREAQELTRFLEENGLLLEDLDLEEEEE